MTDSGPIAGDLAEQSHPLIEEARLARMQAEEAVQRIQHRIERLAYLSETLNRPRGNDDGREQSVQEGELSPRYPPL